MNTDHQPKIIFGIKLSKKQIMKTTTVSVNDCICKEQNKSKDKYCSHCGNQLHRLFRKTVSRFEGFEDPKNGNDLSIEGWPVAIDTNAEHFYVGFYVEEGLYGEIGDIKCDFPEMGNMEQFKTDMKDLGLWDEKMFGAWLVLYVSY